MKVKLFTFEDENLVAQKTCLYCLETKPLSMFPKHKSRKDGYDSRCKTCKATREKTVAHIKQFAPPKPDVCDCCGNPPKTGNGRRDVGLSCDHDPITDTFRGWLCGACNVSIGLLGDNVEGVQKAVDYLKNNSAKYDSWLEKLDELGSSDNNG